MSLQTRPSTTSLYGNALIPTDRAVWVTEDLAPQPRDIYDVTKIAAEQLCHLFAVEHGLPVISLRVSRFFPEPSEQTLIYRLHRGVDVRDVCAAHQLALQNRNIAFDVFNISAHTPFQPQDAVELFSHADQVITQYYPHAGEIFRRHGWSLPTSIDRVYVTDKAETQLGYRPQHNFADLDLRGKWIPELPKEDWQDLTAKSPDGRFVALVAWAISRNNNPGFRIYTIDLKERNLSVSKRIRGCCKKVKWDKQAGRFECDRFLYVNRRLSR